MISKQLLSGVCGKLKALFIRERRKNLKEKFKHEKNHSAEARTMREGALVLGVHHKCDGARGRGENVAEDCRGTNEGE